MAVNLAPSFLKSHQSVDVIRDTLDVYGLAPERFIVELTERGNLPESAFAQLAAIRDLGAKIAIDDFGTGQCSLSYFRDLPADQVKIDQQFVKAMMTSKKDLAIVRGCIDLAHYCDMTAVAEGVEDERCAQALTEMGCDVLQGYWIGKPTPDKEYEEAFLRGLAGNEDTDLFSEFLED